MTTLTLTEPYVQVAKEVAAVIAGEPNMIARYAATSCLLSEAFRPRFYWTGFYLVDPDKRNELVVGPYQGTLGCMRIAFGKGVCGAAAAERRTIIVDDVHAFPGHIACDIRSRSEIVTPVFDRHGALAGVLDVDSAQPAAFTQEDQAGLEHICALLYSTP